MIVGIGDDAAVLRVPRNHELLVTTDFNIEGIHFRSEWHPPESVGHRCLARGLSDIAAMGGEPFAAFLSLAVSPKLPQDWVDRFLKGLLTVAKRFSVQLAGGDTAESPDGVLADILVIGSVPTGRGILRSGARPGDRIFVTGELGGSAAALYRFYSATKSERRPSEFPRHFFPEPRLAVGRVLREKGLVTAMIDLSDGLSTDLMHICEESGCGAEIWQHAIPRAIVGEPPHQADVEFALHGGEDYELLFTASRKARVPRMIAGAPITEIGRVTREPRSRLVQLNGYSVDFEPRGWEHFRS